MKRSKRHERSYKLATALGYTIAAVVLGGLVALVAVPFLVLN